jgi:hypothetical protein
MTPFIPGEASLPIPKGFNSSPAKRGLLPVADYIVNVSRQTRKTRKTSKLNEEDDIMNLD